MGYAKTRTQPLRDVDTFFTSTLEVFKSSSNVTVIFRDGPSLVVYLSTYGYLDFVLWANQSALFMSKGLLGNFNTIDSDDMVHRMNSYFPQGSEQNNAYTFVLSCEL